MKAQHESQKNEVRFSVCQNDDSSEALIGDWLVPVYQRSLCQSAFKNSETLYLLTSN